MDTSPVNRDARIADIVAKAALLPPEVKLQIARLLAPLPTPLRTRAEAYRRFIRAYDAALAACALMTPREQAEAARRPGGPTVDELEARIRKRRGLPEKPESRPEPEPSGTAPDAARPLANLRLLRMEQVSEATGIPVGTLRTWRKRNKGEGPKSAKIGGRVVYRATDVEAWIDAQFGD